MTNIVLGTDSLLGHKQEMHVTNVTTVHKNEVS